MTFKEAFKAGIPSELVINGATWPNIKGRFTSPCGYFTLSFELWADGLPSTASLFFWPVGKDHERISHVSTNLDIDTAMRVAIDRIRRLTAESIAHTQTKLACLQDLANKLENV